MSELQTAVNTVNATINAALTTIATYAENNSGTAPVISDFTAIGVTGVTSGNLGPINSVLASAAVKGIHADTTTEVQVIVDAYNHVLLRAGSTSAAQVTSTDFTALGLTTIDNAADVSLMDSMISRLASTAVDTYDELAALASIVSRVIDTANGITASPALTVSDFVALGFNTVDNSNLSFVLQAIAGVSSPSNVDSFAELKTVVDAGVWNAVPTPAFTFDAVGVDNRINAVEAGLSLTVEGSATDIEDGQTVTISIIDGTNNPPTVTSTVQLGRWTATFSSSLVGALNDGSYTLKVDGANAALRSGSSTSTAFVVDQTAPTISASAIEVNGTSILSSGVYTIDANVYTALTSNPLVISGATDAEDGQTVTVNLNNYNYTTTASSGAWTVSVPMVEAQALQHGTTYTVTATTIDLAGNPSTSATTSLKVDRLPPDTPTVEALRTNNGNPALTGQVKKLIVDGSNQPVLDVNGNRTYADLTGSDQVVVEIKQGTTVLATYTWAGTDTAELTVSGSTWNLAIPSSATALIDGTYDVVVTATAGGKTEVDQSSGELVIDTTPPPVGTLSLKDNVQPYTTTIADGETTNDSRPVLSGAGSEAGSTITIKDSLSHWDNSNPSILVNDFGDVTIGAVVVANDGSWSFAPTAALADGLHTFNVTATDALGNVSTVTSLNFTVDTLTPVAALAEIAAYNGTQTGSSVPDATTYGDAGIDLGGVTDVTTLNTFVAQLPSTATDSIAEVQAVVNAQKALIAYADSAAGSAPLTATQYQTLGLTGVNTTSEVSLLNSVVDAKASSAVDAFAEINGLANIVSAIMLTAAGGTPSPALTTADLAALGITGVTSANLSTILAAIATTADDGTAIDTLSELQTFVTGVNSSLGVIKTYATSNSGTLPSLANYNNIGVTGVTVLNIDAINSALASASVTGTTLASTADVQTLVNAYNTIFAEANGGVADVTTIDPTAADYQAIGVTLGGIATNSSGLSLLNEVVGAAVAADVDAVAELNAMAVKVDAIMSLAGGGNAATSTLTVADFAALGITGVNVDNLTAVLADIAATTTDSSVDTLAKLQSVVNASVTAYTGALNTIVDYANANSGTVPTTADYANAGVTGVTSSNLDFINDVLASATIVGTNVDTAVEVQALISAYDKLLANVDGTSSPGSLTQTDFATLGLSLSTEAASLLNDVLSLKASTDVDTYAQLKALSAKVSAIMTTAAGGTASPALTPSDFEALGITGVTADNLAAVLADIAATVDSGSGVDTLIELQGVVTTSVAAYTSALGVISAYTGTNTAPTVATYADAGVAGVTASTVSNLNTFVAPILSGASDSTSEVQAIVDAYNKLLANADSSAASAGLLTQGDFATLGLTLTAEASSLLNAVVSIKPSADVDTYAELDAIAAKVNAVMSLAGGGSVALSASTLTPADFAALGITGVTTDNLNAVLADIAATTADSSVDTLTKLQSVVTASINDYSTALTTISAYTGSNTAPTEMTYLEAGVSGVTATNLAAINSFVATLSPTVTDTRVEVQAVVNAQKALVDYANAATSSGTALTQAQYQTLGLANIDTASELSLLNNVVNSQANSSTVDTYTRISGLATTVSGIMTTAAGGVASPALTADAFAAIGAPLTDPALLGLVLDAIAATTNDGSDVDSLSELQAIISGVAASYTAALNQIAQYGETNNNLPAPALATYQTALVTGVTASTVSNLNTFVAPILSGASDSTSEVQAIVDAYNKLLANADSSAASAGLLTQGDFATLGLTLTAEASSLLNAVVSIKPSADVDTYAELDAIAAKVNAVMSLAGGGSVALSASTLTPADFAALGITGVTTDNLNAVLADIAATTADSSVDTLTKLQSVVTASINDYSTALSKITQYADTNTGTAPNSTDYANAGVTNIANIGFINDVLASTLVVGADVNTAAEVKLLVDTYDKLIANADGSSTTAGNLTSADFALLGINLTTEASSLLNTVISAKSADDVDTYAELKALGAKVNAIMTTAAGGTVSPALTPSDFVTLGITGVTADNLKAVLADIAATVDNGSAVDTLAKLQSLVTASVADYSNALGVISAYTGANSVPTDANYINAGVAGVTSANLANINSFIAPLPSAVTDSAAEVQVVVDVYNKLLANADASAASSGNLSTADFAVLGLTLTTDAAGLLNTVVSEKSSADVNTYSELSALAAIVNDVLASASSDVVDATISAQDLALIGIVDVTAETLAVVQRAIANATIAQVNTLAGLQAVVDAAIHAHDASIQVIEVYAEANTNPSLTVSLGAPSLSDFENIGVTGVDANNLAAILNAFTTAALNGVAVDTAAEVQAIVNAYQRILTEANGTNVDADSNVNPISSDYTLIGSDLGLAANGNAFSLLSDVVASKTKDAIDTIPEINALASIAARIVTVATGATASPALTPDDFAALGLTGVTANNLNRVLLNISIGGNNGSGVATLTGVQTLINEVTNALGMITAYADSTSNSAPTQNTYQFAGITNVNANNLVAINSALASASITGAQADSVAEVQAIVNAYNRILLEANAAAVDMTPGVNPTPADYALIGATRAAGLNAASPAFGLFTDALSNLSAADVNTVAKIDALASIASRLMMTAAGSATSSALAPEGMLTVADFATLGINGIANSTDLNLVLTAIANSANDGSAIDTIEKLQGLIFATIRSPSNIQAAISKIAAYAGNELLNPAPTSPDYLMAGIAGVTATNLAAINSALATAAVTSARADTVLGIQAIVDAYNRILSEANGSAPDATVANPTAVQYASIGADIGLAAGTSAQAINALGLLNDIVANKVVADIDSVSEINALASIADRLMLTAAGTSSTTPLTYDDFTAIGITGVTTANLSAVLAAVVSSSDTGADINNLASLQRLVNAAVGKFDALDRIQTYAGSNLGAAPVLADFNLLNVTGVDSSNLAAINSALATDAINAGAVATALQVQAVVDAYNRILSEANGAAIDANASINPTSVDYAAIGATTAAGFANASDMQKLLNDVIANLNVAAVDSVAEIENLAKTVSGIYELVNNGTSSVAVTESGLSALGLVGVNANNLNAILAAISASATTTPVTTLLTVADLQALINGVLGQQAVIDAALTRVEDYAQTNGASVTPTLLDFQLLGIANVSVQNIDSVLSSLRTDAIASAQVDTASEIQAIVDAYNLILTEANGASADANTSSNPTLATYTAVGVNLGLLIHPQTPAALSASGLALLNDVVGESASQAVDTVPELQAIVDAVNAVMATASGVTPAPTLAQLALLGLTGVNADNISAVIAGIAATADTGVAVDSLSELQAIVNGVVAQQLSVIQSYAGSATLAAGTVAPTLNDYLGVGVTGVDAANIFAINSALASSAVTATEVNTVAKIQAVVDTYKGILSEANGLLPDQSTTNPTAADYALIGATTAAGLSADGLKLLNNVIGDLPFYAVDSVSEIEALARTASKVMTLAANNTDPSSALTVADLQLFGITGLSASQVAEFVNLLKGSNVGAGQVDTLAEVRSLLTQAGEIASLSIITAYADGTSQAAPKVLDFANAGITGVTNSNLAAINSSLATSQVTAQNVDTVAEVQSLVDAWNKLLSEANGSLADASPGIDPTIATYATVGANIGIATTNVHALSLLNSVIANQLPAGVDSVAEIDALAAIIDRVYQTAAGTTPTPALSISDLVALGCNVVGLSSTDLAGVIALITNAADDGSSLKGLADLQSLINQVAARLTVVTGIKLSVDTGALANDFITNRELQTITATLDAPLAADEKIYGRLDASASWVDLTGLVEDTYLRWFDAQLLTGPARSIQLRIDQVSGSQTTQVGTVFERHYELLNSAPAAPTNPAQIIGQNPSPTGFVNFNVGPMPADVARMVLMVNGVEVPSLYHAMTNTIVPLSELPQGAWQVAYKYEDAAGNQSLASPAVSVTVATPQNASDLQGLDGDGIGFSAEKDFLDVNNDGIDDADQRDVATLRMTTGSVVGIDTTSQQNTFTALLADSTYNPNGVLKVQVQVDSVANTAVSSAQTSEVMTAYGLRAGSRVAMTDILEFRAYPQVISMGEVDQATINRLAASVIDAYIGQIHQIDIRLAEGHYDTYYKVRQDGSIWAFTWDTGTGTGAKFLDTNNDGSIDTVSLFVRDGGRGDDDGVADGVIVDPGFATYVAYSAPTPTPTPTPSNSGRVVELVPEQKTNWASVTPAVQSSWFNDSVVGNEVSVKVDVIAKFKDQQLALFETPIWTGPSEAQPQNNFAEIQPWGISRDGRGFIEAIFEHRTTSSLGFAVRVVDDALVPLSVLRAQPDQVVQAGKVTNFNIYQDVFVHRDSSEVVRVGLTMIDGKPVPAWISIDPVTGQVTVKAPRGYHGDLKLRLIATDGANNQAVTVFKIKVDGDEGVKRGRSSLSEKMQKAAQGKMPSLSFRQKVH